MLHPNKIEHAFACYLKIINIVFKVGSKLSEKLKNGIKILVGQVSGSRVTDLNMQNIVLINWVVATVGVGHSDLEPTTKQQF